MRLLLPVVSLLALPLALGTLGACDSANKPDAQKPKITKRRAPVFKPAPLETLADRGVLKAQKLARPVSNLTKLCPPAKKNKETGTACVCMPVGEPTQQDGWTDDSQTCSTAAEGLEAPFLNVQFLAAQKTSRTKKREEPLALDVQFQLLLQTKKGWSTFEIGSTTMEPALGYPRALTLVSRDFVDLPEGGNKELVAIFNDERTTYLDGGEKEQASTGWLLVCGANPSQKLSCAEPISLGAARKGGYQLAPVVEGGSLYLTETSAKTPAELKKTVGKYSFELP